MNRFSPPRTLPPCDGILPAFHDRFSGWHLGMGLPDTLIGLIRGVSQLSQEDPACAPVAVGMAVWGFQSHPLSPGMASLAMNTISRNALPPALINLLVALSTQPMLDAADAESMQTWHAVVRQDDRSLMLRFLAVVLGSAKGVAWLHHCWQDLLHLNQPETLLAVLDMVHWKASLLPLKARMHAEWAFHTQSPDIAINDVAELDPDIWGYWRTYTGAELLLRSNEHAEAGALLAELWQAIPWHVNLTLKLHDLLTPVQPGSIDDTSEVAILAYSWNKANLLADTFASLAMSDIGSARIFTLNNGSSDHTAAVLLEAQERLGKDRFHIESLPVNIGAPAARNWLLALPEVRQSRWAAFLDDDVVLPENWLRHLLGAAKTANNPGAVGCRITAATPPFGLQSADYNLFPIPPQQPKPGELPNRVLVFDNCAGSVDTGLFSYTRPCLSVSGCCHMVSMQAVKQVGDFDLRYTPSQFDDLDRDLRSALADMPALYTGSLAIKHVQHSSLAKSQTTRQIGHVMGNKYKLDTKYSDAQLTSLGNANKELLWADLRRKYDFLIDRFASNA